MKTIEEKAKAYDEAIEKLKEIITMDNNPVTPKELGEHLFPELAESEDDRIRKWLINEIKIKHHNLDEDNVDFVNKAINWLEKQGEPYTTRDVDNAYLKGITNTKNEIEKQYKANYQIRKDIATFIFNYRGYIKDRAKWMDYLGIKVSFVEEPCEQKPTDKVESKPQGKSAAKAAKEEKVDNANKVELKFHEGDWVVDEVTGFVYQIKTCIENLSNHKYDYDLTNDTYISSDEVNHYHLWTIQDAKDGDVLVNGSNIFIFHFIYDTRLMGYCHVNMDDGRFYDDIGKNDCFCLIDAVVNPATKEQRDLLFQKMKEAGYMWDAEKKGLTKIELKPAVIIPKFRIGDNIKTTNEEPLTITKIDGKGYWSEDLFICNFDDADKWELVEQKPVDTSEIEMKRHNEGYVKGVHDAYDNVNQARSILNQLRRERPKQEWSEEDEDKIMLIEDSFSDYLDYIREDNSLTKHQKNTTKDNVVGYVNWLKSLRPHKQQEWTKKDTERFESCLKRLGTGNPEQPETVNSKWFREHVSPQSTWKPSEEQMEALETILYTNMSRNDERYSVLSELVEELKKLRY